MKPEKNHAEEILNRSLTRHGNLSQPDVDSAMDRAWEVLQPEMTDSPDWAVPHVRPLRSRRFYMGVAAAAAVVLVAFVATLIVQDPPVVLEIVDVGDVVQSGAKGGRVVSLVDGSEIEMRAATEFSVERAADGLRIHLTKGSVIVHAADQRAGHLYVQTKDVTVSVVGTVFLVNAEEAGSRVTVIEGEVRVQQGSTTKNLVRGQQFASSSAMPSRPLAEEVAWSQSAESHVAVLRQTPTAAAPAARRLEFEVAVLRPVNGEKERGELLESYRAGFRAPGDFFGDTAELRCKGIDGGWSSQARNVMASAAPIPLGRCIGLMNAGSLIRVVREVDYPAAAGRYLNPEVFPQDYFQLTAKAEDPRTATKDQLLEMLKNLAYDRLKLKIHTETKEEDGFSIRVAPGGLKIQETLLGEEKRLSDVGGGPGKRTTIQYFFDSMAAMNGLNRVGKMINMTGLMGIYEFPQLNLKTVPPLPGEATGARGGNGANIPVFDYDPPFEEQIEKLLGLRIKREKVPVQYMVIDHVELPAPN